MKRDVWTLKGGFGIYMLQIRHKQYTSLNYYIHMVES